MRGSKRAFSLIEIVVALAILGMLVSSVMLASSRLSHQSSLMARKHHAIQAADQLLTGWSAAGWALPTIQEGSLESSGGNQDPSATSTKPPAMHWSLKRQPADLSAMPEGLSAWTLTLTAPDPAHPQDNTPLTQVTFLAPLPIGAKEGK